MLEHILRRDTALLALVGSRLRVRTRRRWRVVQSRSCRQYVTQAARKCGWGLSLAETTNFEGMGLFVEFGPNEIFINPEHAPVFHDELAIHDGVAHIVGAG